MKVIKTFALSSISLVLMSGCFFEESYDSSSQGTPPQECDPSYGTPEANRHRLYDHTNCADTRYSLTIVDQNGNSTNVDGSGHSSSLNIKTEPAGSWSYQAPIKVTVSDSAPAIIKSGSSDPIDLTIPFTGQPDSDGNLASNGGIVRFFVKPLTAPEEGKKVYLKMSNLSVSPALSASTTESAIDGQYYATYDLTSAMHAYRGVDVSQEVKVPTKCFMNQGVDYTNLKEPFILKSESNFEFELAEIMIRGDADSQAHVLNCETDEDGNLIDVGKVITDTVLQINKEEGSGDEQSASGWATRRRTFGGAAHDPSTESDEFTGRSITFTGNIQEGVPAGYRLVHAGNREQKDVSRFMHNGFLQFDIYVKSYGQLITRDLIVNMETEIDGNYDAVTDGYVVRNLKPGRVEQVRIPVSDLMMTYSSGQGYRVEVDYVRNIFATTFSMIPGEQDYEGDDLSGVEFIINNVYLMRKDHEPAALN